MSSHRRLLHLTRELERRVKEDPLPYMQWLPGQLDFLRATHKAVLLRTGFQYGKTTAGAAELIFRMAGEHPYKQVRKGPIKAWVVCGALGQMRVVQQKVWDLCPKHLISPLCEFDYARGAFVGQIPRLIFRNGSIAEFKSGGAKGANLTSDTVDVVWVDEVPDRESVFDDLLARLRRKNGDLFMTFTPYHRPVDYIRERVGKGQILDLHYDMRPENYLPVGARHPLRLEDGTPMDQAWIDHVRSITSPLLAPVFLDGEWETRYQGAYFDGAWRGPNAADSHVHANIPRGSAKVCIGIDYGHKPGKQVAYLVLVFEQHVSGYPYIYVLDEYVDKEGSALPEKHARGILAMLERNRVGSRKLSWRHVDYATGDRPHDVGRGSQLSNKDLMVAIGKVLGVYWRDLLPRIRTVSKFEQSVDAGERYLYQAMQRGNFGVHPRCERLIDSIPKYCRVDDGPKDPIDALRYAIMPYIRGWWQNTGLGRNLVAY